MYYEKYDQPVFTYRQVNLLYHKQSSVLHFYDTINLQPIHALVGRIYHNKSSVQVMNRLKLKQKH
jgi:hypothetical protein